MFEKIDYWVTAASYADRKGTWFLEAALIHPNIGESHEFDEEWTREQILEKCDVFVFCTIAKNEKGEWKRMEQVRKIKMEQGEFLRVDGKERPEINWAFCPPLKRFFKSSGWRF